ncbi:DoxX family protein [Nocardioides sp. KC13]|uniref:DoxX family protein n=1 Tax=Nocardioides turkmenicus TaxID=2711220 RepID=A0A6M1QYM3_9ACTN|nr:DoxX family protein [Nocardioides sp. KC13]NGN92452.1 DoxX family protein [Nocardioides sp. KC13]
MFIATLVLSILFALLLLFSAYGKLTRNPAQAETLEKVGATRIVPILALLEIAGAAGLIIGLFWWPLGVAAAIGTTLYFIGAVIAHVRVRDKAIAPAAVLAVVSVAIIALRTVSA